MDISTLTLSETLTSPSFDTSASSDTLPTLLEKRFVKLEKTDEEIVKEYIRMESEKHAGKLLSFSLPAYDMDFFEYQYALGNFNKLSGFDEEDFKYYCRAFCKYIKLNIVTVMD